MFLLVLAHPGRPSPGQRAVKRLLCCCCYADDDDDDDDDDGCAEAGSSIRWQ